MNLFWIALLVCAAGGGLIHLGDGASGVGNKVAVVVGVTVTIVGIGVLRYLLFAKRTK